jgi:predicted O-methyltransferase YrrM
MNIDETRLAVFLQSMKKEEDVFLERIRQEARAEAVPIIRDEMADLMLFLMRLLRPERVLEVGCAVGYSAILMAKSLPDTAHITTIENYEKRIPVARQNIAEAGLAERITLIEGDAGEVLPGLSEAFDFIFMDAAKAQYITWLPEVLRLLKPGGVLVTDNVLQEGDLLESRFAVTRRNRTIHARMREYLYALKNTAGLTTTILNVGDGAALSLKEMDYEKN